MKGNNISRVTQAYTHSARFHADDVFSAALIKYLNPSIKINRVSKILGGVNDEAEDTIIFDIGCGIFDHHQNDAEVRPNGIKYAAFGLLWRELGPLEFSKEQVEIFDTDFVQPLDYTDNTGKLNPMSYAIRAFLPTWNGPQSPAAYDEAFYEAVDFALDILVKVFFNMKSSDSAHDIVDGILDELEEGAKILVLEKSMPWQTEKVLNSDILYVVYPSARGGWHAQAVPTPDREGLKLPFPEHWAGKRDGLNDIGVTFCHSSRHMIAANTLEQAVNAADFSIKLHEMTTKTAATSCEAMFLDD